ncbi:MAG: HNH endonuclease [Candidatus Hydrogenedentes bacterium]|nr:HNH endonuclease [Candidatus Hydrogenedentota bacterium]
MLDTHVLVLNKSWVAVHVAPARRALCLLYHGAAQAVHPDDYSLYDFRSWCELSAVREQFEGARYVHTTSLTIRVPEVIMLCTFNGFIRRDVPFTRRNLFARDRNQCQYCGKRFPKQELTIDHVLPRSRGGKDTWNNLVLACTKCNVRKGNRLPDEAGMPLLRDPGVPRWLPRLGVKIPQDELMSWQRFIDTSYWDAELEGLE